MAEVAAADFHIGAAFDLYEEEDEIDDRSYSYWPYEFEHEEIYSSDSDDPFTHHHQESEEEDSDYDDLFPHLHQETPVPNPNPNPDPVVDTDYDTDPYFTRMDMVGGAGLDTIDEEEDDFFVGRRDSNNINNNNESREEHVDLNLNLDLDLNLSLQGYFSEEDLSDGEIGTIDNGFDFRPDDEDAIQEIDVNVNEDEDFEVSLCWDSLRLEEEWEDVVDRVEVEGIDGEDDGDVLLGLMMDYDERVPTESIDVHEVVVDEGRNLDWQVLLQDVNDLEREHDFDLGPDDFVYPAEYDTFFGQFLENESVVRGSPPTAKAVVEGLPSIVLTQEDIQKKGGLCAVCKDEISIEEKAKQLPCSHYYHGECILPWLNMRNTCPVCRFELPTDDAEYEQRRRQRANGGVSQVRYNFQMFA